jgi:hypothetical protein
MADLEKESPGNAWEVLRKMAGTVNGPPDWSEEHDHYLYGTPRKNPANEERFKDWKVKVTNSKGEEAYCGPLYDEQLEPRSVSKTLKTVKAMPWPDKASEENKQTSDFLGDWQGLLLILRAAFSESISTTQPDPEKPGVYEHVIRLENKNPLKVEEINLSASRNGELNCYISGSMPDQPQPVSMTLQQYGRQYPVYKGSIEGNFSPYDDDFSLALPDWKATFTLKLPSRKFWRCFGLATNRRTARRARKTRLKARQRTHRHNHK